MATPSTQGVNDATLQETRTEITTVLVHLSTLLHIRNQYRSPLLRLPTEIIVHILSFVMEDLGSHPQAWRPIFTTCHHIHKIMCDTTSLWWKVDVSLGREAEVVLMRSRGTPREVFAWLDPWDESETTRGEIVLRHWRDQWVLHGDRLRALEIFGSLSDLPSFFWIFGRPLPCLERLTLHIVSGLHSFVSEPVVVQLPTNVPLRVLDLRSATVPWSSNLFAGLRELHLDFRNTPVPIMNDEWFGILGAAKQLECLTILQSMKSATPPSSDRRFPPKPILQLPVLTFLKLQDVPGTIGYFLACTDTPALASLEIQSRISDRDVAPPLHHLFPRDHLLKRLLSMLPVVEIKRPYQGPPALSVTIGGFEALIYIDVGGSNTISEASALSTLLAPPSVTTLKLARTRLDLQVWRDFFGLRTGIQSIEFTESHGKAFSNSL